MKTLLSLLLFCLLVTSCNIPRLGMPVSHKGVRYVKTSDGSVVYPAQLYKERKNMVADDKKIPLKEVVAYCDGTDSFLRYKDFLAEKVMNGDINIYNMTFTTTSTQYTPAMGGAPGGFHTSTRTSSKIFLQGSSSPALMLLNYNNVKSLIKTDEPAYKYILQYEHGRKVGRIWGYSSLAVALGGIVLAASVNTKDPRAGIGLVTMFGGAFSGWACLGTRGLRMQLKLHKAISMHNGILDH